MKRAYKIQVGTDPSSLPFVFDDSRSLYFDGIDYVEVDGYLIGGQDTPIRGVLEKVPESVSRFQARAILHLDGTLATVEALVAQADAITQIAWQDAQEFKRNSPSINNIAAALGWSAEYVDDMFIRASKIEA